MESCPPVLRLSMFQCMISGMTDISLRAFAKHITNRPGVISVTGKSPGLLGSRIDLETDTTSVLGSLSIRLSVDRDRSTSFLLFSNGKLKMSGGFGSHEQADISQLTREEFEEWLWVNRVSVSFDIMNIGVRREEIVIKVFLINGSCHIGSMDMGEYIRVCEELPKCGEYPRVVNPVIFASDTAVHRAGSDIAPQQTRRGRPFSKRGQGGRICAIKLYTSTDAKVKSSIHFDHRGKSQLFAFTAPKEMHATCERFRHTIRELV